MSTRISCFFRCLVWVHCCTSPVICIPCEVFVGYKEKWSVVLSAWLTNERPRVRFPDGWRQMGSLLPLNLPDHPAGNGCLLGDTRGLCSAPRVCLSAISAPRTRWGRHSVPMYDSRDLPSSSRFFVEKTKVNGLTYVWQIERKLKVEEPRTLKAEFLLQYRSSSYANYFRIEARSGRILYS